MLSTTPDADHNTSVRSGGAVRPVFLAILLFQVVLITVRWTQGDMHGACMMFVVMVAGLAVVIGDAGGVIDSIYCAYFAVIAMVSGLIDLDVAVRKLLALEKHHNFKEVKTKDDFIHMVLPAFFFTCAFVQFTMVALSYFFFKEGEQRLVMEEDDEAVWLVAQEGFQYSGVQARPPERQQEPWHFTGVAHKLA